MKIHLFFLTLGISAYMCGQAQNTINPSSNSFRHHEFSVSYGFIPVTDWNSIAGESIFPVTTFGLVQRKNAHYYGALNISYMYRLNYKISLGISGGITGNKGDWGNLYDIGKAAKDNRTYLYILPTFRYHWFTRKDFSLYSSAGAGVYFLRNKLDEETLHKTKFAYQFNYLGIEYGKRILFFTEFGIGNEGTIIAGGRVRF